jgi:predicted DNA-binding protein with PD1-like motif
LGGIKLLTVCETAEGTFVSLPNKINVCDKSRFQDDDEPIKISSLYMYSKDGKLWFKSPNRDYSAIALKTESFMELLSFLGVLKRDDDKYFQTLYVSTIQEEGIGTCQIRFEQRCNDTASLYLLFWIESDQEEEIQRDEDIVLRITDLLTGLQLLKLIAIENDLKDSTHYIDCTKSWEKFFTVDSDGMVKANASPGSSAEADLWGL